MCVYINLYICSVFTGSVVQFTTELVLLEDRYLKLFWEDACFGEILYSMDTFGHPNVSRSDCMSTFLFWYVLLYYHNNTLHNAISPFTLSHLPLNLIYCIMLNLPVSDVCE
jgi:hypothetical protein